MFGIKGESVPVQTSVQQTADVSNVGHYKRWTYKRQTGTNVGQVQTADQYKRQTSTNVGLVQTADQYKRRTSTNGRPVQTADQFKRRTGTNGRPV